MVDTIANNSAILTGLTDGRDVELQGCPICNTDDWIYFGGRWHFGLRVEYWICDGCGLVGQSPTFNTETLRKFYTLFYRELYEGSSEPTVDEYEYQKEKGRRLLRILKRVSPDVKLESILDFGCSVGGLLSTARDEHDAKLSVGVELDAAHARKARDSGIRVCDDLEELRREGLKFDVVTTVQVLEHIPDIVGLLSQLREVVKDDGYLCVEVPHSCQGCCFEICHLWGFNESSMSRLLQKTGFEVVAMSTHGFGHAMWRHPEAPERQQLNLVAVARKSTGVPNLIQKSSAHREILKRYLQMHPDGTLFRYHRRLFRNTLKQLVGHRTQHLVAHSYKPSRLR